MPSQVPLFTMNNYASTMDNEFTSDQSAVRISIWEALAALQNPFVEEHSSLDARNLWLFLSQESNSWKIYFNKQNIDKSEVLVALKLLCPTLRCCEYFYWNIWQGTHAGIDIMLPKNTPIMSFTDGKVIRIKTRDWVSKNEGNCIAIQSTDGYVVWYEHLERIDVSIWQQVIQWEIIGLCGTTGNSTQYHLHLQVDKWFAPFHPYRSQDLNEIKKYTIDPLPYLRARSPTTLYRDIPIEENYSNAIMTLTKWQVIKGFDRHIYPENMLQRYHAALIVDRVLRLYSLYDWLEVMTPTYTPYTDNTLWDRELDEALVRLQKYGIMKWNSTSFEPTKNLKWEQLLALIWRIFYWLSDSVEGKRYDGYVQNFINLWVIGLNRWYVEKSIPRKEVFLLLASVLKKEEVL